MVEMEEEKKQENSEEIKNMTPVDEGGASEGEEASTPSQEESGFHEFPQQTRRKLSLPSLGGKKVFAGVAVILLLLLVFLAVPLFGVYNSGKKLASTGRELQAAVQSQNLENINTSLSSVKRDLEAFDKSLNFLVWIRPIPFLGGYWVDAKSAARAGIAGIEAGEILIPTIAPYADVLGFDGGKGATTGAQTAEERIDFIVETIDEIIPKLTEISGKTEIVAREVNKIDPNRYPAHFRGRPLREQIKKGIELANQAHEFVSEGRPFLEQAPHLLGIDKERTYLFVWQNDKELRPTGGFITAYSVVRVKDGKFEPVASDDIYHLDNRFNSRIPAPEPIKKYLPLVPYWNLRDMNLSPDFKVSMDTFTEHYETVRGAAEVDGIIAVDTHLLVDLLRVMGRIGVPGFGNYSAEEDPRCNCPQVIYELESFADVAGPIVWDPLDPTRIIYRPPHSDNRKAFLGPLMNSIIANAMAQPKNKLPDLLNAGWNALREKHVLFYMHDEGVQKAVETFGVAGRIVEFDGDYLHINDTNFAGAKSNLYVEQEVELQVEPGKEGTTNTLTIRYRNPQEHDGWLNGPFRDWLRVYVPQGSELIDSTGSEVPITTYEELGKTVFEGFFTLRPLGVLELKLTYKTPVSPPAGGGYRLLIQKQPGKPGFLYSVKVGKKKEEFKLLGDKELSF